MADRALHLSYGEFSQKFAQATASAPFLKDSVVIKAEPGAAPSLQGLAEAARDAQVDVLAWAHNETSRA